MSSQIVLMTGCSSGIGLITAKRLALDPDQRFVVIATVIAMPEKSELEAAVGDALNKTIFIKELDLTEDSDITTVVHETLKTQGRIDVLPAPYMDFYSSTKFALEGFFEGLAVSLRSFNIRVCIIEPGPTKTGLIEGILKDLGARIKDESIDDIDRRQLQAFKDLMPKYDLTTPEDVATAIVTRCLDVDEPVLRHLLPEALHDGVRAAGADITGETVVNIRQKRINAYSY